MLPQDISKKSQIIRFVAGAVAAIILIIGAYILWNVLNRNTMDTRSENLQEGSSAAEKITEKATDGVLPSVTVNPLENKPDLNPVATANPFKDIKTNPFK